MERVGGRERWRIGRMGMMGTNGDKHWGKIVWRKKRYKREREREREREGERGGEAV